MLLQALILLLSIVGLYFGAEFTLNSAEKLGKILRIPPLVIGLIIIGFGTSLPEFFVSHISCLRGESAIALGNIVGSNIANIFLILGVGGLLVPMYLAREEIKKQLYFHLLITILLAVTLMFSEFYFLSGVVLFSVFIYYLYYTFKRMERVKPSLDETPSKVSFSLIATLLLGFFLLYISGEYLVSSGSKLGIMMGVSPYIISAIFVAFGTSFPELVTALIACIKKKDVDLITGNIIGSNIFNVAFVLGSLGFYQFKITQNLLPELILLVTVAVMFLVFSFRKIRIYRTVGASFLAVYIVMVCYWSFYS